MSEPSEYFLRAFCHSGTSVADCEFCGRVHYDSSGECMDEGELEDLQAKHEKQPEKYIPHDGSITFGHIAGKQFVWGCSCEHVARYENFIWSHRFRIADYFKARAKAEKQDADRQFSELGEIPVR